MLLKYQIDKDVTTHYHDYHAETDPDNQVEHFIENGNFDDNVIYSKTNEIFEVMNNEEFLMTNQMASSWNYSSLAPYSVLSRLKQKL